jgi:hypothetical protein
MSTAERMLQAHPTGSSGPDLAECISACYECAQACTSCADACLGEQNVGELIRCIRLNQDCFDICVSTGNVLSRRTEPNAELIHTQLQACVVACRACAAECEGHAHHMEHCRICAEACRRCEAACTQLADTTAR